MTDFSTLFCEGVYTRKEAWTVYLVTNIIMSVFSAFMIVILTSISARIFLEVFLFCQIALNEIILYKRLKDITESKFLICFALVVGVLLCWMGLYYVIILCIPSVWIKSKYVQKDLEDTSLQINQLIEEELYQKAVKKTYHIINIYSSHFGYNAKEVIEFKKIMNLKFQNKRHFFTPIPK